MGMSLGAKVTKKRFNVDHKINWDNAAMTFKRIDKGDTDKNTIVSAIKSFKGSIPAEESFGTASLQDEDEENKTLESPLMVRNCNSHGNNQPIGLDHDTQTLAIQLERNSL